MKVILQLFKEFWLPLLLGIAWTVYNFLDKPVDQWRVRDFLNVFGPTFFFMSWLVAQWYRVRKQQRVEEGLAGIAHDIRAMQSPLLPCGLFFTLKFVCPDENLARVLSGRPGYNKYGAGGLSPSGVVKLKHPGYNSINYEAKHTYCSFSLGELKQIGDAKNSIVLAPLSVTVEFFF